MRAAAAARCSPAPPADGCILLSHPGHRPAPASLNPPTHPPTHPEQVRGLEFNPFSPNLLATGGADGELCIWDVASPAQPSLYPAMKARQLVSLSFPGLVFLPFCVYLGGGGGGGAEGGGWSGQGGVMQASAQINRRPRVHPARAHLSLSTALGASASQHGQLASPGPCREPHRRPTHPCPCRVRRAAPRAAPPRLRT